MVDRRSVGGSESEEEGRRSVTPLAALEEYSGNHSETIEQLLEWPYRRFVKAYEYWQQRRFCDKIDEKCQLYIAAITANTNWDDEKNDRSQHIKDIEEYYDLIKREVIRDQRVAKQEQERKQELEANDPFLQAGKRNLAKVVPPTITFQSIDG